MRTEIKIKNRILASTTERVFAGLAVLAGIIGVFVVWFFNPTTAGFFPNCPLHALSGLSCPGCGLTRGFHALFHGDILAALQFNLLLPVYLAFFGYLFVSLFLTTVRGRGLSFKQFTPITVFGYFALSIAFTILRNLPVYPFNLFAV